MHSCHGAATSVAIGAAKIHLQPAPPCCTWYVLVKDDECDEDGQMVLDSDGVPVQVYIRACVKGGQYGDRVTGDLATVAAGCNRPR